MLSLCAQRSIRTGRTVAAAHHLLHSHNEKRSIAPPQQQEEEERSSAGDVVVVLAVAKHDCVGCVRGDELARRAVLADLCVNSGDVSVRGRAKACVALAAVVEGDELVVKLIEASEEGDCWAMLDLGLRFDRGDGVEKDMKQAVEWWQQAAQLGNEQSMKLLHELDEQAKRIQNILRTAN